MKIRNLDIGDRPVLLAPMEDVTIPPFRLLCKKHGADLVYTEFVSSDALIRSVNRTMKKLTFLEEEHPVVVQIYGKKFDVMAEAARISEEAGAGLIDINFGCPVRKIATKGGGAGMLKDIPKMLEITKAVVNAVTIPVTVKTRLGWDAESKVIVELAERLQDTGIDALTIHGRTRCQMYSGEADWSLIGKVKNNPRMFIPIIGNGDITTPQKAEEAFNQYGVDAIMIGRGAIGKPWIFREVKHYLTKRELLPPASLNQQVDALKKQITATIDWIDEYRGILHMRRHMAQMFKGLPNFKQTRISMLRAVCYDELVNILDAIVREYGANTSAENS